MRGARLAVRGEAFPSRFTRSNKEAVIMSADKRPSFFFFFCQAGVSVSGDNTFSFKTLIANDTFVFFFYVL